MNRYQAYLKSDHWTHLKLKKSKTTKRCFICRQVPGVRNFHHVRYKSLTDVQVNDIRLSCQDCHHFYHAVRNEHPDWRQDWILNRVRQMVRAVRSAPKEERYRHKYITRGQR